MSHARRITDQPLLLRLDGGNDSIENIDVVLEHNQADPQKTPIDFIIKWNPRKESKDEWLDYAKRHGEWESPREGKRVARNSCGCFIPGDNTLAYYEKTFVILSVRIY